MTISYKIIYALQVLHVISESRVHDQVQSSQKKVWHIINNI